MFKRLIIIAILLLKLLPMQQKADGVFAQTGEEWVYLGDGGWGLYLGDGNWDGNIYEFGYTLDELAFLDFLENGMGAFEGNFGFTFDENGNISFYNDPMTYGEETEWANYMNEYAQTAYNENQAWAAQFQDTGGYVDWNAQEWLDYLENLLNNNGSPPTSTCAGDVSFYEDPLKKYGYDNHTTISIPWKSIEQGNSDVLITSVSNPSSTDYNTVYFKSLLPSRLTVSPPHAPSAAFDFTITALTLPVGTNKAEIEVQANCLNVNGDNIDKLKVVSYRQIIKKVAITLVHSKADPATSYMGYQSTDVPDATILAYLNDKCYNQAIVKWQIVSHTVKIIDFDINQDGAIENNSWSSEILALIAACESSDPDVINLYLVDNSKRPNTNGVSGLGNKHSFVHVNHSSEAANTIAHELGHSVFSYSEAAGDVDNIMYPSLIIGSPALLRKYQWDAVIR
jgi:hypothetical protein